MDARAPFSLTRRNIERISKISDDLNKELQNTHAMTEPPFLASFMILPDASEAQLYIELLPVAERPGVEVLDIVRQLRETIGQVEGATEVQIIGTDELAGGLQIQLHAKDEAILDMAGKETAAFLSRIKGVENVVSSRTAGQPEFDIKIKPEARSLGFDAETIASQIGYAFGGAEVQKVRRDGDEFKVIIKNSLIARNSAQDLMQSHIRSKNDTWVPLNAIASIKGQYITGYIERKNGKLVNTLSATVNRQIVAPEEIGQAVTEDLIPHFASKYPGVTIIKAGELEEMEEIKGGMKKALILALVLIYILMAVPLRSYWQPFVILTIIPFGFIGAAIGHVLMDLPLLLILIPACLAIVDDVKNIFYITKPRETAWQK